MDLTRSAKGRRRRGDAGGRTETALSARILLAGALCLGLSGGTAIGALAYEFKAAGAVYEDPRQNLHGSARQEDTARWLTVTFKRQVQEWKDAVVRGCNPEDLARYCGQLRAAASSLSGTGLALLEAATDPAARQITKEFLHAQAVIRNRYEVALRSVTAAVVGNRHETDQQARGQDRAVPVRIGKVVDAWGRRANAAIG